MTAAVAIDKFSVRRGGDLVVRDVALTVPRSCWIGLIGANGSGKTSLLRAIGGRLPIVVGSCRINGGEFAADRAARAGLIGFSPPADRLPDTLRCGEMLELISGSVTEARMRLGPLCAALQLDSLLDRWIGDCSAGMRQRIAIATAFAGGHSLVILDEPFNWLDPVAAFDVRQALRSMVDNGMTLLTALHDLGTLATACDEGVMLVDGRVALTMGTAMLREAAVDPQNFERRTIDLLRSRIHH